MSAYASSDKSDKCPVIRLVIRLGCPDILLEF